MVRFIIPSNEALQYPIPLFTFQYGQIYYSKDTKQTKHFKTIYIPIWLDLLSIQDKSIYLQQKHLHSNMVRFIISPPFILIPTSFPIYIPIWLDLLFQNLHIIALLHKYLHSNMVRFIIEKDENNKVSGKEFTFQYGQIYYNEI